MRRMIGASWVAGSVRARLLTRHCLGPDGARDVAATGSLEAACARLAGSSGNRSALDCSSAAAAQHAIWATVVWDLRVLAGWLPGSGVAVVRDFAGFFEIDNLEAQLAFLADGVGPPAAFELGSLGTVWTRARAATSVGELRAILTASPWRDPGTQDRAQILARLRFEWARRLGEIDEAGAWGAAAAALVVARSLSEGAVLLGDLDRRAAVLGRRALGASTLQKFVEALPDSARWVFDGLDGPEDLWRAETAWWRRLDHDGERLLRGALPGPRIVVGAVARRMADAWRTCAALDIASRGASALELVDVLA
jgi:hypothetical protein